MSGSVEELHNLTVDLMENRNSTVVHYDAIKQDLL